MITSIWGSEKPKRGPTEKKAITVRVGKRTELQRALAYRAKRIAREGSTILQQGFAMKARPSGGERVAKESAGKVNSYRHFPREKYENCVPHKLRGWSEETLGLFQSVRSKRGSGNCVRDGKG